MAIKFKTEREKKLFSLLLVGLAGGAFIMGKGWVADQLQAANRAPIIGNHSVQVDTSQLVDVDELPLFASMSDPTVGNPDGYISSDIFSQPVEEEEEVPEVLVVEVPEVKPEEPRQHDFNALTKEQFFLSAVLRDGAVINNIYHRIGDSMVNELETGRSNHKVTLVDVGRRHATLRIEDSRVTLRLP